MIALLFAASAAANTERVTRGDAEAILQAWNNGGWAAILNGGLVEEGAPTDFLADSMARIAPMPMWNGRHFCSLDWHVIAIAAIEGNPEGGSRTNEEIRSTLSQVDVELRVDGVKLETTRTAISRMLNPELRGLVEAFSLKEGRVMAPEELSVGQHSLQFIGRGRDRPPTVTTITFFIDAPGEGTCL